MIDAGGLGLGLACILGAYFMFEVGKSWAHLEQEREDGAAPAGGEAAMIEECILRARQIVVCEGCGHAPLCCWLEESYIDPSSGENMGVLAGRCPACFVVNYGKLDQHHLAMVAALYEWDRSGMKRDLLELESVDMLTMSEDDY